MTTLPPGQPDRPAPPTEPGLQEGIYLEKKKGNIGTGGTARTAEYRNFWATGRLSAESAVMVLLDNEFKPTGLKETFSLKMLTGPNWFYIAEGEKKYQRLRPYLDNLLAGQPQPTAAPTTAPANPFELKKDHRKPTPKKGGWWDK